MMMILNGFGHCLHFFLVLKIPDLYFDHEHLGLLSAGMSGEIVSLDFLIRESWFLRQDSAADSLQNWEPQ